MPGVTSRRGKCYSLAWSRPRSRVDTALASLCNVWVNDETLYFSLFLIQTYDVDVILRGR